MIREAAVLGYSDAAINFPRKALNMQIDLDPDKLREDVIARCVETILGDVDLHSAASDAVEAAVKKKMQFELDEVAEKAMSEALEHALQSTVTPTDIWGQPTGDATTLRAAIHRRAKDFWNEKVDGRTGKRSTYGGTPRYEMLLKGMVKEEFEGIVKDNLKEIVAALKEGIRKDFHARLDANLDVFIKTAK